MNGFDVGEELARTMKGRRAKARTYCPRCQRPTAATTVHDGELWFVTFGGRADSPADYAEGLATGLDVIREGESGAIRDEMMARQAAILGEAQEHGRAYIARPFAVRLTALMRLFGLPHEKGTVCPRQHPVSIEISPDGSLTTRLREDDDTP